MNSYFNLIIALESAKERLGKWFQSVPERNDNRGRAGRTKPLTPSGAASLESIIWIVSFLIAILGLIKAAHSEQPLFWLAVWPFPTALTCTIFIFVRQAFHFERWGAGPRSPASSFCFWERLGSQRFFSDRSLR